jgi:hypothetical protein
MNHNVIPSRLDILRLGSGGPSRLFERPSTRRTFLGRTAGAAGLLAASGLVPRARANGCGEPKPIPGGINVPPFIHILLPGYPGFGMDPATNDPSVITDFNGHIGLAYVRGMGTHTDLQTGAESRLPFEVDLRFMKGEYVDAGGRHMHGAFALI